MISILLPIYNGQEYINDCISSILKQSFRNFELIVGINGHNEEGYQYIVNIINKFEDSRIKILSKDERKGKVKILNRMTAEAKYDIIALIDVDDIWYPHKLIKQLKYIDKYDVVGSDAAYFQDRLGTPGIFLGKISYNMFSFQNPIINSAAMIRKDCAKWNESWEGLDDYHNWVNLISFNKIFYNVPEILIGHRVHKDSCYNNINEALYNKLKKDKKMRLNIEDYKALGLILDECRWEL